MGSAMAGGFSPSPHSSWLVWGVRSVQSPSSTALPPACLGQEGGSWRPARGLFWG